MSTPSTAVATLPHYQPRHYHSPYSHSHAGHHQQQGHPQQHHHHNHHNHNHAAHPVTTAATPTANANHNYRPTATNSSNPLPPTPTASSATSASRLLPFYQPANAASSPTDGVTQSSVPPRPPPHAYLNNSKQSQASSSRHDESFETAMSSATVTATVAGGLDSSQSRKRRRSKEPDWKDFYRNGLPKEVIVIDDTPEPEANTGRKITNGSRIVGSAHDLSAANQQQPTKRRRRDDASNYHVQYLPSQTGTPHQTSTPGVSTLSSDRHTSALTTTAPTSLSSNGHYDDAPAPLKRKRTRQQAADEAKRRDIDGLGDPFITYIPPPYPPKKAADVHVRVVHDVSDTDQGRALCIPGHTKLTQLSQRHYNKAAKVDDEDGHYIVVPDADLTEKCTSIIFLSACHYPG